MFFSVISVYRVIKLETIAFVIAYQNEKSLIYLCYENADIFHFVSSLAISNLDCNNNEICTEQNKSVCTKGFIGFLYQIRISHHFLHLHFHSDCD
jgi:hypothetical protein